MIRHRSAIRAGQAIIRRDQGNHDPLRGRHFTVCALGRYERKLNEHHLCLVTPALRAGASVMRLYGQNDRAGSGRLDRWIYQQDDVLARALFRPVVGASALGVTCPSRAQIEALHDTKTVALEGGKYCWQSLSAAGVEYETVIHDVNLEAQSSETSRPW